MSVYGLMVVKNEADRYLNSAIINLKTFTDKVLVYDDQSTDATPEIAGQLGVKVVVRPDEVPSFSENEGQFRQAAWNALVETFNPCDDDFVFVNDADEFLLVNTSISLSEAVKYNVKAALEMGVGGVEFEVAEVFGFEDNGPFIRTDGYWGQIKGVRMVRLGSCGKFERDGFGCGATPDYGGVAMPAQGMFLMHYGYARKEDRILKYNRYVNQKGHNPAHVRSIIERVQQGYTWLGRTPVVRHD